MNVFELDALQLLCTCSHFVAFVDMFFCEKAFVDLLIMCKLVSFVDMLTWCMGDFEM